MSGGLVFENVSHAYGQVQILRDVSFDVAAGEVVCLLGPSGSGKTTILRLAAGLEMLQQGRIALNGVELAGANAHIPPENRNIGLVFQDFALFPDRDLARNIAFGLLRWGAAERDARVAELLEQMGLSAFAKRYPHGLSAGQAQRVALARALAPRPKLMLMDEAFSSLDTALRESLRTETLAILKATGVPSVIVTHDPEEAMALGDRILILDGGRIVQDAPPPQIYRHPANRMVAGLFGHLNEIPARVESGMAVSALGSIAVPGRPEGGKLTLYLREAGVKCAATGPGLRAKLVDSRPMGGWGRLQLLAEGAEPGLQAPLFARVPFAEMPQPGAVLTLTFDPAEAFIFAD